MLEYRRAVSADSPALAELRLEFMRIVKDAGIEDEDAWRDELLSRFSRDLDMGHLVAWLCLDKGRIVGTSGLCPEGPEGEEGGPGGGSLVFNMFTLASHRRRGIGGELLRLTLEEGRSRGLGLLRLQSTDDGRGLYERAGFVDEGRDMVLELCVGAAPVAKGCGRAI